MARTLAVYPESKVQLQAVLDVYFSALHMLSLREVAQCLKRAIETSRFFPKVSELLEISRSLNGISCKRCPQGHGIHEGHRVTHFPAGPYCNTCQAEMAVPAGYCTTPIAPELRQLPQSTSELSHAEVRALVEEVIAKLNQVGHTIHGGN